MLNRRLIVIIDGHVPHFLPGENLPAVGPPANSSGPSWRGLSSRPHRTFSAQSPPAFSENRGASCSTRCPHCPGKFLTHVWHQGKVALMYSLRPSKLAVRSLSIRAKFVMRTATSCSAASRSRRSCSQRQGWGSGATAFILPVTIVQSTLHLAQNETIHAKTWASGTVSHTPSKSSPSGRSRNNTSWNPGSANTRA